ncbi:MAG: formyltransferase family protein [Hyphomicrobiales bacterium]
MKVTLIIQDEPFYPGYNVDYILKNLKSAEVVSCVLSDFYPYGKKDSFMKRAKSLMSIYGTKTFMYYLRHYLYYSIIKKKSIPYFLKKYNIPVIKLDKSINAKESIEKIKSYHPDLLVSVTSTEIFKSEIINLAPKGCINSHHALLPSYKGLQPTFWILKNGEEEAGESVFYVNEGVDTGDIIVQRKFEVPPKATHRQLLLLSKLEGAKAIIQAIDDIANDKVKVIKPDYKSSYYTFPKKEDVIEFEAGGNKMF